MSKLRKEGTVIGGTHVFFDVGGVLANESRWLPYYYSLLFEEFNRKAYRCNLITFHKALAIGISEPKVAASKYICNEFIGDSSESNRIRRKCWHTAAESYYALVYPDQETLSTLLELRSSNFRLGIIANQSERVYAWLDKWGLRGLFSVFAFDFELGVGKPDAEIYRHACKVAGCAFEEAIMVGDRIDNDMRPARSLGIRTVWYCCSGEYYKIEPLLDEAHPDAKVTSMVGVPSAISTLTLERP